MLAGRSWSLPWVRDTKTRVRRISTLDMCRHQAWAAARLKDVLPFDFWVMKEKPNAEKVALYWFVVDNLRKIASGEDTCCVVEARRGR